MAISNNTTGVRPGVCTSTTRPTAPYEGQQIYETDTNRVLVWDNATWIVINGGASSYQFVQTIYFTSSGTFTKATYPWLRAIRIKAVGGGGGSGGTSATSSSQGCAANGGGGGCYAETFYTDIASLASSVTVTIGAGGTAGSATPSAGGTGGTTSFGSLLTAGGGGGSVAQGALTYAYSDAFINNGSGTATGADFIVEGQDGFAGMVLTPTAATYQGGGKGGAGGGTFLGVGGTSSSAAAGGGNVGTYGGGGGGRYSGASSAANGGHAGAAGVCIVELYS